MAELFLCPSCGARLNPINNVAECAYCGNVYNDVKPQAAPRGNELESAAKDAISFTRSLNVEVNGNVASITDMWHSLINDRSKTVDSLINFYKKLKPHILFCIEAYEKLSDDVRYELGDFVCAQMESIIKFREEHYFVYLDELDEIEVYINQLTYNLGACGFFNFMAKRVIKGKIARANARKVIVLYDYSMQAMEKIVAEYNTKIEPLKEEYNATARTAVARRKELKFAIDELEVKKQKAIDRLCIAERTKNYNKVIKKYNIKHTDFLAVKREARKPVAAKPAEKEKVDYSAMSILELVEAIEISVEKLERGITRGEADHCKQLVKELSTRAPKLATEENAYARSIVMMLESVFKNEHPAVMKAVLDNSSSIIKTSIVSLKGKLS